MPRDEVVAAMTEALAFLNKVALFYDKYHILQCEQRRALQHGLRVKHVDWTHCKSIEQQHVDLIETLTRELRMHYDEWMQDDRVARKRWRRHPAESMKRMLSESANTTTRMHEAIAHQSRKLSAIGSLKDMYE